MVPSNSASGTSPSWALEVTLDFALGGFSLNFSPTFGSAVAARGTLCPTRLPFGDLSVLSWRLTSPGVIETDLCHRSPVSIRALIKRILRPRPVARSRFRVTLLTDIDFGHLPGGTLCDVTVPAGTDPAQWLAKILQHFIAALPLIDFPETTDPRLRGRFALATLVKVQLGLTQARLDPIPVHPPNPLRLTVTLDAIRGEVSFNWDDTKTGDNVAAGWAKIPMAGQAVWELTTTQAPQRDFSTTDGPALRSMVERWTARFPTTADQVSIVHARGHPDRPRGHHTGDEIRFGPTDPCWDVLMETLLRWAVQVERRFAPRRRALAAPRSVPPITTAPSSPPARTARPERPQKPVTPVKSPAPPPTPTRPRPPVPAVAVHLDLPALDFPEATRPLSDLRGYFLRERAAAWWVSNQSDDLLALPHCKVERLDYQVRSALRVLGPLRGRALLSDEVGLGKTVEAGLVLKELLIRGMVKRFLVLTVPSLVDQWEEELNDKFNLTVTTTNQALARADPATFWRDSPGIVASLHTLKQPAQLQVARTVSWDLLVVDEAHYLRNRESQAWQAVNALPRQFLLLLTATPVQNSLEELYNLITLLQPGQLPTPKEFRARFVDPKRPRQPREPDELRRLLGQVMIRNTRANAGINLPPRRAETVLFEPTGEERMFWQEWEAELRVALATLPPGLSTLWGRLLLQAAGSSPAAWRDALERFPDSPAAAAWRERTLIDAGWRKKVELLPPLTRVEGGLVIFTQFLKTQAALAEVLRAARVETFVVNGATPAAQRQPITEEFRQRGGALLLTHSGTEGRNLQFCHQMVNFDLPWNPMEIEQRIGRLHRLGQRHPVRIYNLVQAGTLQEHLLRILQEKLNLFELVVGETGLILGERFSSDEFAEEVLRRWRESEGRVAEALESLGDELAAARSGYQEVRQLDETLFARDYESL